MASKRTPAHDAANSERRKRKYSSVGVVVYKSEKEKIRQAAEERNDTMSGFINKLIAKEIPGFVPIDSDAMNGRN